jgi:hypothetical protein
MIDIPFAMFLTLLALAIGLGVALDFRRRRRVARDRRESEYRGVMGETVPRDPPPARSST